ncbi:hypothetical protein [Intestinibacter bartlettii]|uniref:hypothetical protein n=1 Tax=Intestinibacter bartlettii TaxID=261299 RepID=UPI00248CBBDF|nr:hypothetical protein [Intestinibacter bartlettii]
MLKKIFKKKKFFLILGLLLISFIFIQKGTNVFSNSSSNALFLKHKGDIYIDEKDDNLKLSLIFVDSKNSTLFNDLNEKLKSDSKYISNNYLIYNDRKNNVEIYLDKLNKGNNYKDICLYSMDIDINFLEKNNSYDLKTLELLGKKYYIGDIFIKRIKASDDLSLISNLGLTKEMNSYDVQLENQSKNIIKSINVKNNEYINNVYYFINSKKVEKIQNIKPKDNLKIAIKFKADVNDYDIFYFSPNIEYQIQNEKRNIVIPFASYGLPIEEDEMSKIYKEFKDNF